ncbi:Trm112 family protein [Kitasatospora sp. NBC_01287]|uniref:Trm112 family protein n=1 Tax=Kitasatospora sp. NBC_01287 TaxID=2903573 RepID=UPI0022577699|nr:Trm112 family protein [Kitasatospora sp. NBC_01287]MCX4748694.1 Trm112 family protein [Kitasatospora sp. NBC_01287]
MTLEPFLLEILVCPSCHAALRESAAADQPELACTGTDCGLAYPVRDGIPVLLVDEARRPA